MVVPEHASESSRVVGRYMLFDEIAAGGMATVRFGRLVGEVGFSRTVAVKCLHPQYAKDEEFAKMFLDEAKLAARVRHPNVVPILDVVAREGELFLVMDYVQGESLSKLVRAVRTRKSRIPLRIVATILAGALDGLHAAHEAKSEHGEPLGIVHRDVSPQNIIVGLDGVSRVLDFGVAKAAGRVQTTRDGQLKGKLAYMAPEQLKSHDVDRRTDIYAAAVVLWEALAGRRLFKADDEIGVFGQVLAGKVPPPSSVISSIPKGYDEVTLRGLHLEPSHRFATAREMAIALEKVAGAASPREVGAWVEDLARETLRQRAAKVAELESVSTLHVAGVGGPRGPAASGPGLPASPTANAPPPPRPPPRTPTPGPAPASAPSQVSGVHVPPPVSISHHEIDEDEDGDALTLISDTTASSVQLSTSSAELVPASQGDGTWNSHSQLTSLSMAQAAPAKSRPKPGVLAAVIGVALIAAIAAVVAFGFAVGAFDGRSTASSGAPDAAVPAVASPDARQPDLDDAMPDAAPTTPKDAAARDAVVDAADAASEDGRSPATKTASPPPPTRTAVRSPPRKTSTPKPPKGDCNPPFTIDSRGVRVPKPHCL